MRWELDSKILAPYSGYFDQAISLYLEPYSTLKLTLHVEVPINYEDRYNELKRDYMYAPQEIRPSDGTAIKRWDLNIPISKGNFHGQRKASLD